MTADLTSFSLPNNVINLSVFEFILSLICKAIEHLLFHNKQNTMALSVVVWLKLSLVDNLGDSLLYLNAIVTLETLHCVRGLNIKLKNNNSNNMPLRANYGRPIVP